MTIVKNLFLPIIIVLVIYAIPVVPTWRALKRRKASFGAFLGWVVGEILIINLILFSGTIFFIHNLVFALWFSAIIISSFSFLMLPFVLLSKSISRIEIIIGFIFMLLIATLQIYGVLYLIAYSAASWGRYL